MKKNIEILIKEGCKDTIEKEKENTKFWENRNEREREYEQEKGSTKNTCQKGRVSSPIYCWLGLNHSKIFALQPISTLKKKKTV